MDRRSKHHCRPGVTLLELLLVLAIIVALVAMAVPSFKSSLQVERLRRAAGKLRVEWARARVKAMKSGATQAFFLSPTSGQFLTTFYAPNLDELTAQQQASAAESAANAAVLQSGGQLPETTGKQLGEGVTFLEAFVTEDNSLAAADSGSGSVMGGVPILFYPDGTTSTARVTIGNEIGDAITLTLRGLTGAVRVGGMEAREALP